jgi:hypothetical protein
MHGQCGHGGGKARWVRDEYSCGVLPRALERITLRLARFAIPSLVDAP